MKNDVWICDNGHQSNDLNSNQCVDCTHPKPAKHEQIEAQAITEGETSKKLIDASELILVLSILVFLALFDYLPVFILHLFGISIIFFGFVFVNRRWRQFFGQRKI